MQTGSGDMPTGSHTGMMAGSCNMSSTCSEASPCKDNHPLTCTCTHEHTHTIPTLVSAWAPN